MPTRRRLEATVADRSREIWLAVGAVFAAPVRVPRSARAAARRAACAGRRRRSGSARRAPRFLPPARAELARGDRDAERDRRGEGSLHRGPLGPRPADRSRDRRRAAALDRGRLETLGLAASSTTSGKLAVPDAVLHEAGAARRRRVRADQETLRARARSIVGKLGQLRATVPLIRHHHERWDGRGYPDGLGRDAIPLEAAVIGLADAWDAMTTDRPYHRALTLEEALRGDPQRTRHAVQPRRRRCLPSRRAAEPRRVHAGDAVRRARRRRRRVVASYGSTSS